MGGADAFLTQHAQHGAVSASTTPTIKNPQEPMSLKLYIYKPNGPMLSLIKGT